MGIKKWTRSINESNKTDESIESLRDALTTISDDYALDILKAGPKVIRIKIVIEDRTIGDFRNQINHDVSIEDIENISKKFMKFSNILNKINESILRSDIDHDSIHLSIFKNAIFVRIIT